MIDGLQWTVRTHGWAALYRGLAPTLIGSIPKAGIRFGGNSAIKKALADENGKLNPCSPLLFRIFCNCIL